MKRASDCAKKASSAMTTAATARMPPVRIRNSLSGWSGETLIPSGIFGFS
jgi:hypothetical protein